MFKTVVIYVDEFENSKGGISKIVYFNNSFGLQCKAYVNNKLDIKKGDNITIDIKPDFNGFAKVFVSK